MNILFMIILISLLIFVHEFGHFLAAKMCGMKVSRFGFGLPFGPTLYEKKIGDTIFCIHACLLGGYVSFPDDDKDSELPADSPDLFKNKPVGQRAFVAVAGVTANVICAIVLVLLTAFLWGKLPSGKYDIFVDKIVAEKGASVYSSGMQAGDKIVNINGSEILHPLQVNMFAQANKAFNGEVTEERANSQLEKIKKLNPNIDENVPIKANTKILLPKISEEDTVQLSRLELFGIEKKEKTPTIILTTEQKQLRDRLLNQKFYISNGKTTLKDVAIATSDTQVPLTIIVERNNKKITLNKIYPNKEGLIGIQQDYKEVFAQTTSFSAGIKNSYNYLYTNTELMIWSLGQLFTGQIPMKNLTGIVAVTKIGGDIVEQQGHFKGILLAAIISLNLAIMNLLPIPALDGGHLVFLFIEKLRGRPLNEKALELVGNICFYILLVLMILLVFKDILFIMHK